VGILACKYTIWQHWYEAASTSLAKVVVFKRNKLFLSSRVVFKQHISSAINKRYYSTAMFKRLKTLPTPWRGFEPRLTVTYVWVINKSVLRTIVAQKIVARKMSLF
jgi:hypothetical protein